MRWSRERVPASIRILVAALATIVVVAAVPTAAGAQGSDPDAPVSSEETRAAARASWVRSRTSSCLARAARPGSMRTGSGTVTGRPFAILAARVPRERYAVRSIIGAGGDNSMTSRGERASECRTAVPLASTPMPIPDGTARAASQAIRTTSTLELTRTIRTSQPVRTAPWTRETTTSRGLSPLIVSPPPRPNAGETATPITGASAGETGEGDTAMSMPIEVRTPRRWPGVGAHSRPVAGRLPPVGTAAGRARTRRGFAMQRYAQIMMVLVVVNAIAGILVLLQVIPWPVVAATGVVLGLWWLLGQRLLGAADAS